MSRPPARSFLTLPVIATVTIALSACGGADEAGSANDTGSPSPSPSAMSSVAVNAVSQYTGVAVGEAYGTPVRIGFINSSNELNSSRDLTPAVKEAVRAVNDHLGGVKGRPIDLRTCLPLDAAQVQKCADDFAADPSMVAVLQGSIDSDVQRMHATLAPKLPVLGAMPLSQADGQATNAYYLSSGQFGSLGVISYARDFVKAKRVAVLALAGSAGSDAAVATLRGAFQAVGIEMTTAAFPPEGDMAPAIVASRAAQADLILPAVTSPQQCVNLNNTLNRLSVDTPVLAFAACLGLEVRAKLGDYPRWSYLGYSVNAEATPTDDVGAWQARAFTEWFRPVEAVGVTPHSGVQAFQLVLTLVKALAAVPGGNLTPRSAAEQMKRLTGPVFLGAPRLTFGAIPGMPAIGTVASRVYLYFGNSTWRDSTNGQWLEPPRELARRR